MDMNAAKQRGALVLVHGAWHGTWCWEYLLPVLNARGWSTSAVGLPTSAAEDPSLGMYDDARAVREHLERIDGPVTVVAHSYGGVPVSEVADTVPNVTHLVYVASPLLEAGEALIDPTGPWFPPDMEFLPVPESAREMFFHDVPAERAEAAEARLRPHVARVFTDKQTHASWRTITSTLVLCDEDRALPGVFAELGSSRATVTRRFPGGHSPFLSRPAELADVLDEATQAIDGARR
jgi:pimeloyl-ACP methyl ester carboxylesterase